MSPRTVMFALALVAALPAQAATLAFSGQLSPTSEVPPVTGEGSGTAEAKLDTTTHMLTYTVTFGGFGTPITMAHFHGPAGAGVNAGVQIPLAIIERCLFVDGDHRFRIETSPCGRSSWSCDRWAPTVRKGCDAQLRGVAKGSTNHAQPSVAIRAGTLLSQLRTCDRTRSLKQRGLRGLLRNRRRRSGVVYCNQYLYCIRFIGVSRVRSLH